MIAKCLEAKSVPLLQVQAYCMYMCMCYPVLTLLFLCKRTYIFVHALYCRKYSMKMNLWFISLKIVSGFSAYTMIV